MKNALVTVISIIAFTITGCASAQSTVDLTTLSQGAFAARTAYALALSGANVYAELPRCEKPSPPPCSKQAIVDVMREVAVSAGSATKSVEAAVRDLKNDPATIQMLLTAAQLSVKTFGDVVATYKEGK